MSYLRPSLFLTYYFVTQINDYKSQMLYMLYFCRGFANYMASGGDSAYQQLCSEITVEFNDCSKQVWSHSLSVNFRPFSPRDGKMSGLVWVQVY